MHSRYPLVINGLSKSYREKIVLRNIDLKLKNGEIYGLVGLNAIGKTTLIKTILGLTQAKQGEVLLFGKSGHPGKHALGYMPEQFQASTHLKGREFLQVNARLNNRDYNEQSVESLCNDLDFPLASLNQQIAQYSKGLGQKLGLISLFMNDPKLLILDEPMTGLDVTARILLKRKLLSLKESGKTIFFSSHILSDIEEICDRIGILHDGAIFFDGKVSHFLKNAKSANLEEAFLNIIEQNKA
jgi:ABC-2 type transport system ATP-binding protein